MTQQERPWSGPLKPTTPVSASWSAPDMSGATSDAYRQAIIPLIDFSSPEDRLVAAVFPLWSDWKWDDQWPSFSHVETMVYLHRQLRKALRFHLKRVDELSWVLMATQRERPRRGPVWWFVRKLGFEG